MVSQIDIEVYQGDDWAGIVSVVDANDNPVDLTGFTPAAQVRLGPADNWPVLVEMSATVDGVTQGQINLAMTSAQTAALTCNYLWDLQITDAANVSTTLMSGRVLVTQEITREVA
jgi:hypothetical protein